MVSMTLAIPAELKKEMDTFPEMNWSAVARKAIEDRIDMLKKFKEFTKNSTMTPEDARRLGRKVNEAVWKKHYRDARG